MPGTEQRVVQLLQRALLGDLCGGWTCSPPDLERDKKLVEELDLDGLRVLHDHRRGVELLDHERREKLGGA